MRGEDRRQIQTAVLGGAESDEPLMLPLEAIELDAFRRRHEHDTFWCGLLLGGCGLQLTTKLYTDRVCHFAHHPGPDGHHHLCGRRARGVSSADHLYVKAAAAAWLRDRATQADFEFVQPDGVPIGSVVDIRFTHGELRVHLNQAVAPSWDQDGHEPVLGVSVPVDRDILIDRWYVHRIRLDSEGTARRVQIGTEAFARDTEWFALDDCEMTERGLSTPAVEQIVRSRSTRPVTQWGVGKAKKAPPARVRAQVLLRKLTDAVRVESSFVVSRVLRDIADLTGVEGETKAKLAAAVSDAEAWLEDQVRVRRELFSQLEEALAARDALEVRRLLARVNAIASHDRTADEITTTDIAAAFVAEQQQLYAQHLQAEMAAKLANQQEARERRAAGRVQTLLATLQRREGEQSVKAMRKLVRELTYAASDAGDRVTAEQKEQIGVWKTRADIGRPPAQTARPAPALGAPQATRHEQVARRYWIKRKCPRCQAVAGKNCVSNARTGTGAVSKIPHYERIELILAERRAAAASRRRAPGPYAIACPDCGKPPGERCLSPNGGVHRSRAERAREARR
ncbi:zinc finger domain-containing protein [Streptomyces sviceus]|uniref:zinc finger domain-containing protein n=1 Tax=Streptomyces sviceus TaxID=285530 RepID=UPI003324F156